MPIILSYSTSTYSLQWGVFVQTSTADNIASLSISTDGNYVLAQTMYDVIILNAASGTIYDAFSLPNGFPQPINPPRSLIMNSFGAGVVSGDMIAAFQIPLQPNFQWSTSVSSMQTMGLVFGNPEASYVINFATVSTESYVSIFDLTTGTLLGQKAIPGTPVDGFLA